MLTHTLEFTSPCRSNEVGPADPRGRAPRRCRGAALARHGSLGLLIVALAGCPGGGSGSSDTSDGMMSGEATVAPTTGSVETDGDADTSGPATTSTTDPVECRVAADCPADTHECVEATCEAGVCGVVFAPFGTDASGPDGGGDCHKSVCDGEGGYSSTQDETDAPGPSGPCVVSFCDGTSPTEVPEAAGTRCKDGERGAVCDGEGQCVECVADTDCAGGICGARNTCVGCEVSSDCAGGGLCDAGTCVILPNDCDPATAIDLTRMPAVTVEFGGEHGLKYAPRCLRVSAGTAVTFSGDFTVHPLVGGLVAAGMKQPAGAGPFFPTTMLGASKEFVLDAPGEHGFYCDSHALEGMKGAVFVE
jgi:plastocyanin